MSTTDGTVIRDCRSCQYSAYSNRFIFECGITKTKKTRPCKCKDYQMDPEYAKANKVKLHKEDNYVYQL